MGHNLVILNPKYLKNCEETPSPAIKHVRVQMLVNLKLITLTVLLKDQALNGPALLVKTFKLLKKSIC